MGTYSPNVPADNLYLKDIPSAIREKAEELRGVGEGYPPIVNADKVDGFDASQTPGPNTIVVTDANGNIPGGFLNIGDVALGAGLKRDAANAISMEAPGTCTAETTNAFPAEGGHTHKLDITLPEVSNAFAFYENFAGYTLAETYVANYTLVKTFTIAIPNPGVYMFDCVYKVLSGPGWSGSGSVKVELTGGTMIFGQSGATYSEELTRRIVGYVESEINEDVELPVYEPTNVIKRPLLSGRMVYFAAAGNKMLNVYMMGFQGYQISDFCLGVIGAGT